VKAIPVLDLERLPRYLQRAIRNYPDIELYNFDIPLEQLYLYEKGLFPLAHVCFEWEEGQLLSLSPLDSPWILTMPSLPCARWRSSPGGGSLSPSGKASFPAGAGRGRMLGMAEKDEEEDGKRLIEGLVDLSAVMIPI